MSNFKLDIQLGNEAMTSGEDIARALRSVAEKLEDYGAISFGESGPVSRIMDLNGNTVGNWVIRGRD